MPRKEEYQKNPERYRMLSKLYAQNNIETVKTAQKAYRDNNKEQEAKRKHDWYIENKEKSLAAWHRRRHTLKMGSEGSYTDEDVETIYKQQLGKCAYCGIGLNGAYHVDHIIPLSRGGTNWPDNLACACAKCNLSKGSKLLSDWKPTIDNS